MEIPNEVALSMVRAAHHEAARVGASVTAVVVDDGGRLIALGRMDSATPITVDLAVNKAYTAAAFRRGGQDLAADAQRPWFQSLVVSSGGRVTARPAQSRSLKASAASALSE